MWCKRYQPINLLLIILSLCLNLCVYIIAICDTLLISDHMLGVWIRLFSISFLSTPFKLVICSFMVITLVIVTSRYSSLVCLFTLCYVFGSVHFMSDVLQQAICYKKRHIYVPQFCVFWHGDEAFKYVFRHASF